MYKVLEIRLTDFKGMSTHLESIFPKLLGIVYIVRLYLHFLCSFYFLQGAEAKYGIISKTFFCPIGSIIEALFHQNSAHYE